MRKILVLAVFAAVIGTLVIASHQYLPLDHLVANEVQLRNAIHQHPLSAWLIGCAVYFGVSLVPGTTGKAMIAGWLFGLWPGVLLVDVALTATAITTFLVSRVAFQEVVQTRFRFNIDRTERGLLRDGAMYLLLLRLAHAPYTFMNYACGATRVRLSTFTWTAAVGLLPGSLVFVFAGTRLPTLAELLDSGPLQLLEPWLLGGLALTALLPLTIRFAFSRLSRRSVERIDTTPTS